MNYIKKNIANIMLTAVCMFAILTVVDLVRTVQAKKEDMSNVIEYKDEATGCQYLLYKDSIIPRYGKDHQQVCE